MNETVSPVDNIQNMFGNIKLEFVSQLHPDKRYIHHHSKLMNYLRMSMRKMMATWVMRSRTVSL